MKKCFLAFDDHIRKFIIVLFKELGKASNKKESFLFEIDIPMTVEAKYSASIRSQNIV